MEFKTRLKNNAIMIVASFLLALSLGFSVYYQQQPLESNKNLTQAEPDSNCDLNKTPCSIVTPGGATITLSITPRPIPLLRKFNIEVKTESINVSGVTIDFQGISMNMGLNRIDLNADKNGAFNGQGALPVCLLDSMKWQAQVFVKTDAVTYVAPFIFTTHR